MIQELAYVLRSRDQCLGVRWRCKQYPVIPSPISILQIELVLNTYVGRNGRNRRVRLRQTNTPRTLVNTVDPHLLERSVRRGGREHGCKDSKLREHGAETGYQRRGLASHAFRASGLKYLSAGCSKSSEDSRVCRSCKIMVQLMTVSAIRDTSSL